MVQFGAFWGLRRAFLTNENPFCQNNVDSAAYSRIGSYAPGYMQESYQYDNYRILRDFSFSINVYETSLGNVIKRASGQCYNVSETSFTSFYIKMTTAVRFFLSRDFSVRTDPPLDTSFSLIMGLKCLRSESCNVI